MGVHWPGIYSYTAESSWSKWRQVLVSARQN